LRRDAVRTRDTLKETNPVYRDAEAARPQGYAAPPAPPPYLCCPLI
jgi:N-terminal half of MaoC dehydratase